MGKTFFYPKTINSPETNISFPYSGEEKTSVFRKQFFLLKKVFFRVDW